MSGHAIPCNSLSFIGNQKNLSLPPSHQPSFFYHRPCFGLPKIHLSQWIAIHACHPLILPPYPSAHAHFDQHHHCDSVSSFLKLNTIAVSQPHCDSVSSFLQTEHHSTFNMQQMISEEVAGMARPERFLAHHVELSCQLHRKSPRVSRHATIVQLLF